MRAYSETGDDDDVTKFRQVIGKRDIELNVA